MAVTRREIDRQFRERLQQVIDRSGLAPTGFARSLGIDRSTLSQLLSPDAVRLPRAETLAAIAVRHDVSVDWLLGLTSDERPGAAVVESVLVEGQAHSPIDARFVGWHAEAEAGGYRIRTVPRSFPDFLKSEAVIAHEFADRPDVDAAATALWARERLARMRDSELNQEFCLPLQTIHAFVRGEDQWGDLDREVRAEQVARMAEICRELYPSLAIYLYDVRRTFSAPFAVFGPRRATVYLGSLFFVFTAREHVRALNRRFDDIIRAAVVQPSETPALLARLGGAVV